MSGPRHEGKRATEAGGEEQATLRHKFTAEERLAAAVVHQSHLLCLLARGHLYDLAAADPLVQVCATLGIVRGRPIYLVIFPYTAVPLCLGTIYSIRHSFRVTGLLSLWHTKKGYDVLWVYLHPLIIIVLQASAQDTGELFL